MLVPYITDALGWSALWYFMLVSTVISCFLMLPKIYSELFGYDDAPAVAWSLHSADEELRRKLVPTATHSGTACAAAPPSGWSAPAV